LEVLEVDIGGSGIKAAVVDVSRGSLVSDRIRRETPRPARPGPMAEVVAELVRELGWKRGPIGCGFPGVVRSGVVLVLTVGTGIGSALFLDGRLVPNTEFGHLEVDGEKAEHRASDRVRTEKDLSWKKWAAELERVLLHMEAILQPERIVLGGGVSKRHEKFLPRIEVAAELVPAELGNDAGIVGAALAGAGK
jgi:polyphosphate glucokinase